jgi:hypothetical protein
MDYVMWVIDRHRDIPPLPVWLGMARIGVLGLTVFACIVPRMFVWEPVSDTLRARAKDPESFAHKLAVGLAISPIAAALVMAVSGGPAGDVYMVTGVCIVSVITWTLRYLRRTGVSTRRGSQGVNAG